MNWVSFPALYFIAWWIVLFAVLPFGLKTQQDDGDVTLGTVPSAPRGPHMLRVVIWTTVVTSIILGAAYGIVNVLGFGIGDIPQILPDLQ